MWRVRDFIANKYSSSDQNLLPTNHAFSAPLPKASSIRIEQSIFSFSFLPHLDIDVDSQCVKQRYNNNSERLQVFALTVFGRRKDFTVADISLSSDNDTLIHHFENNYDTTASEQRLPLLVHTSGSDSGSSSYSTFATENQGDNSENMNRYGNSTSVEAHDAGVGENYRKTGDDTAIEMNGDGRPISRDVSENEVLGEAIANLENKKTKWWAYLTTKDFWLVLLLG